MSSPTSICRRSINAEPLLFIYSVGFGLYVSIYQAFFAFKICLTTVPTSPILVTGNVHDFCVELVGSANASGSNVTKAVFDEIEASSTRFMIFYQIVGNVPAVFVAFIAGACSDARGRKPPIIVALAGSTIGGFIMIVTASIDAAPLYLVLIATFISNVTGQVLVIFSGSFAMISDVVTDPTELTLRIGLASGVISFGILIGNVVSGVVLNQWDNYSYIFVSSSGCVMVAFLYTVFFAYETLALVKSPPLVDDSNSAAIQDQDAVEPSQDVEIVKPEASFFRECCDFRRIRESLETLVKERPGHRRLYILLSLFGFFILFACDVGMSGIYNLYVKRPPLSLTDSQYSYLLSCSSGATTVGMALLPWLFKRVLHMRDTFLIIVGLIFGIGKMFLTAFASHVWMIVTATTVGSFSAIYFTGYRAFLSKMVDRDETGRLFAAVTASENIGPLLSVVVFNNLFAATLDTFAGCVYLVAGLVMCLILFLMIWVHINSRDLVEESAIEESAIEETVDDERQLIQE